MDVVTERGEPNRLLGQLSRVAKAAGDAKDFSRRPGPSAYIRKGWGAFEMAAAFTAYSAQSSELEGSFCARAGELGLPRKECDAMGPRATLRRVAGRSVSAQ